MYSLFPPLIFQHSFCPDDEWLVFDWFASFTIMLGKQDILMMEELERKKVHWPNVQQHKPLLPH